MATPTIFVQAVPDTITEGDSFTLSWVVTNAVTFTSNELGSLAMSGSMVITPATSQFYHFEAVSSGYSPVTVDAVLEVIVGSNEAAFNLQKVILTMKQDRIPVRGKN